MVEKMNSIKIKRLTESGILLAISFVLSMIKVPVVLSGASVSLASMLPIILLSYKYGVRWGVLCGFVFSILQMIAGGIWAPPTPNFLNYTLVILLDYLFAFSSIGLAGIGKKLSKKPTISIVLCTVIGMFGRFVCSFTSGVIIWGVYAPEGQGAVLYSFIDNGTIFALETIFTSIVAIALINIPVLKSHLTLDEIPENPENNIDEYKEQAI